MKERPMLFSGPMVRALLDGSKTQTRRVVKYSIKGPSEPMDTFDWYDKSGKWVGAHGRGYPFKKTNAALLCPYGQPGRQLWVRETWRGVVNIAPPGHYKYAVARYIPDREHCRRVEYAATQAADGEPWRPSIHMPRWASRITLEITGVRVERLQDISEADAIAEGIVSQPYHEGRFLSEHRPSISYPSACAAYRDLWEAINGPGSWDANPWVWAVGFKRVEGGAA